jgi:TRAP-type C4-dicarboxylate transport system permease small subunit
MIKAKSSKGGTAMAILRRIAGSIFLLTQIIGAAGLISLMLVVGGTVIYRWFGGTFQGSYEVAEICTILTITMCIFMATVKRGHVDVRILHDRLPAPAKRATNLITGLTATIFWALTTFAAYTLASLLGRHGEFTDVLQINIVPLRWVIVTGFAAVTLVLFVQTLRSFLDPGSDQTTEMDAAHSYESEE